MKNLTKYSALVTTTLLIIGLTTPANAEAPRLADPVKEPVEISQVAIQAPTTSLSFEKPAVTTVAAPKVVPVPAPVVQTESEPVAPKTTAPATPATPAPTTSPVKTAPAPTAPAVTAPASGKGAAILSAAMAQLGIQQDCTMLVTNSLRAVGINFHDWPAGYLSLGTVVPASAAQPGDLIYYANGGGGMAHIAVYAGNGMAVHGGFNGNQTIVFSANVGSGPVFIRVA